MNSFVSFKDDVETFLKQCWNEYEHLPICSKVDYSALDKDRRRIVFKTTAGDRELIVTGGPTITIFTIKDRLDELAANVDHSPAGHAYVTANPRASP